MEVKDLQKLIEERAAAKLTAELVVLARSILNCPLVPRNRSEEHNKVLKIYMKDIQADEKKLAEAESIRYLFELGGGYDNPYLTGPYLKALFKFHLPAYIEAESRQFMQKVDELQQQVQELFENKVDRGEAGY